MWKRLSDPNTLPLIGAYMDGPELVMVSEWMDNGNIKQYLERNSRVNKPALVSPLPRVWLAILLIHFYDSWRMLHEAWSTYIV